MKLFIFFALIAVALAENGGPKVTEKVILGELNVIIAILSKTPV